MGALCWLFVRVMKWSTAHEVGGPFFGVAFLVCHPALLLAFFISIITERRLETGKARYLLYNLISIYSIFIVFCST